MNSDGDKVYFIQGDKTKRIKIGYTRNVKKRIKRMQLSEKIKILLVLDGGQELESQLHEEFKDYHIHGEWFTPSDKLIEFIQSDKHRMFIRQKIENKIINDKAYNTMSAWWNCLLKIQCKKSKGVIIKGALQASEWTISMIERIETARQMAMQGTDVKEIAKAVERTTKWVYMHTKDIRQSKKDIQKAKAIEFKEKGMTQSEIAKELNVSRSTVIRLLKTNTDFK